MELRAAGGGTEEEDDLPFVAERKQRNTWSPHVPSAETLNCTCTRGWEATVDVSADVPYATWLSRESQALVKYAELKKPMSPCLCSPSRRWWPRRRRLAMPVDERCGGLTAVASRLERAHSREEIKVRLWFTSKLQMELCYCGDLWCNKNVTSISHRCVHLNASILHYPRRTPTRITPPARSVRAGVLFHGVFHAAAHHDL